MVESGQWPWVLWESGGLALLDNSGGSDGAERDRLLGLALKDGLDPAGQERLVKLLDAREAKRENEQEALRFRSLHGGFDERAIAAFAGGA